MDVCVMPSGAKIRSLANSRSGWPLTPIYLVPVEGTGILGTLRPDVKGNGYAAPAPGSGPGPVLVGAAALAVVALGAIAFYLVRRS